MAIRAPTEKRCSNLFVGERDVVEGDFETWWLAGPGFGELRSALPKVEVKLYGEMTL